MNDPKLAERIAVATAVFAKNERAWEAGAEKYTGVWVGSTQTRPDGSLVYRNVVPTPGGGEFEIIRTTHRRRG